MSDGTDAVIHIAEWGLAEGKLVLVPPDSREKHTLQHVGVTLATNFIACIAVEVGQHDLTLHPETGDPL